MHKIQNKFPIAANERLCPRFYRLAVDAKSILKSIRPGQFLHIRVTDGLEPFFRRPFSVYRAKKFVEILYEPIGLGTRLLAEKKPGEFLDILGPLGNHFTAPPKGTKQVWMVAGGIGLAPFLFLSDELKHKGYELILFYGGRSKGHVFPMKEFKNNGVKTWIATDDGSIGVKGWVSELFRTLDPNPTTTMVYTCGPHAMLASVQSFVKARGLRCEASCEEVMACALGACLGCSIPTVNGYKTVCYDGPVFDIAEVVFS